MITVPTLPQMTVIVEDINARVALAREHVVRGELPDAASNFREALFLVDRCGRRHSSTCHCPGSDRCSACTSRRWSSSCWHLAGTLTP